MSEPQTLQEMHALRNGARDRMWQAGLALEDRKKREAELQDRIAHLEADLAAADEENRDLAGQLAAAKAMNAVPVPNKVDPFIALLSDITGFSRAHIKSDRREVAVVKARCIVYWLAKHFTRESLPSIGRRIGGKDHTTVLHGVRKVERVVARLNLRPTVEDPEQWAELLWGTKWPKHNESFVSPPSLTREGTR